MMNRTEIINKLISIFGYISYLEIGIYDAKNFNSIRCIQKLGVDPNHKITNSVRLTSDDFFKNNKKFFDVIFIDGLHHKEQVVRDIDNSLKFLKPNGSIVVHDCNPTTKEMQQVPQVVNIWTGDVWRAWLQFRRNENLHMVVLDCDYGVGVIRKGKQEPIEFDDNITFEEFNYNKIELLNLIPCENEPVSICIPVFEQYGHVAKIFPNLLKSISKLNGKFEVIVTDNSKPEWQKIVSDICSEYDLNYYVNPDRGISRNTNYAISKASHNIIKPMYQDDTFINAEAINSISFAAKFCKWGTVYGRKMDVRGNLSNISIPKYNDELLINSNTIGMPSSIFFRKCKLEFDEILSIRLDCDFYYQLNKLYAEPSYVRQVLVGLRYWNGSTSRMVSKFEHMQKEVVYLKRKHSIH